MANSPANTDLDPHTNNEQRYMALLALTAQQLPVQPQHTEQWQEKDLGTLSSEEWEALYRRLDADPAALESFFRRERTKVNKSSQRATANVRPTLAIKWTAALNRIGEFIDWISGPRLRYAVPFGVAAVAVVLVVLQQMPRSSLDTSVEQSFAGVSFPANSSNTLVLPWEHSRATLGFAAAANNDSEGARAFANGLLRGKQRLVVNSEATHTASTDASSDSYAALGEWNVLLWAACQSEYIATQEFWGRQKAVAHELATVRFAAADAAAIAKHLENASDLLAALASGDNSKRNSRRLADELTRFREEIAPSDSTPADPNIAKDAR